MAAKKPVIDDEPEESITKSEPGHSSTKEADPVPATTDTPRKQPVNTAQSAETEPAALSSAEGIPKRVFSSPVEGGTKPAAHGDEGAGEAHDLAATTSNTKDAPVVGAEKTSAPVTEATSAPTSMKDPTTTSDTAGTSRIAPSTETTVSGPSRGKSPKEKESKVSSWLKTKFSRRTSKAQSSASSKPEDTSSKKSNVSEPSDPKVFVGRANLGASDDTTKSTTKSSSDQGESSMREVAMAGRNAGPVDAPVVSPTEPDPPSAAGAAAHGDDDSTSISSLSSDEDMRGRSAVRLADAMPGNQPQVSGSTAAAHDRPAAGTTSMVSRF